MRKFEQLSQSLNTSETLLEIISDLSERGNFDKNGDAYKMWQKPDDQLRNEIFETLQTDYDNYDELEEDELFWDSKDVFAEHNGHEWVTV